MFQLGTIKTADTLEIELRDPTDGSALGWHVTLAGPAHPVHSAKVVERQRRLQAAMLLEGRDRVIERSVDEQAAQRLELAVACTIAWRGVANGGAAELACTPESVRQVLSNPDYAWVVDQIAETLADRSRFIRRSAPS